VALPKAWSSNHPACRTLAPTVQANYTHFAEFQQCAEATLLPSTPTRGRELIPTNPTAEECYRGCSLELGLAAPFYFSLFQSGSTSQYYCCQTCTLVSG
jgi:hypothetical protein